MSKKYHNTEHYYDQQIEFTYEGRDYIWEGDYTINTWGETADYEYPGDSDVEVIIENTNSLVFYEENVDSHIEVRPTTSLLNTIEIHIERNL